MVLPDRIELSTSPLPMECSTTELRQRARMRESTKKDPDRAGRSLPQGLRARKRANGLLCRQKRPESARKLGCRLQLGQLRPNPAEIPENEAGPQIAPGRSAMAQAAGETRYIPR